MNNEPPKQKRRFEGLRSSKHVQRRLKKIESATLRHAHKFIFQRWKNVQEVRRHALAWLMLVGVLIGSLVLQSAAIQRSYQVVTAAESGTYAEGVLGQLDSLNPIFATTHPERSASKLLFSGLLSYDASGALKTDLAESWQVSEDGRQYTVVLKDDLKWQDGAPITSKDV
ncbi:hypothetical protein CYG49_03405, partial [Candidatus Saccharibacteria bacterium]